MDPVNLEESDLRGMEVCNFAGTELALPIDLIEEKDVFFKLISMDTWKSVLTQEDRKHLETFLPELPTDYPHAQEENLSALLGGQNFWFGNPVQQFQQKLKDGYFYPDVVKYKKLCRKAKLKEYKIQQQKYHRKLLREILISRQEILDQIGRQGPGEPINTSGQTPSANSVIMEHRVNTRLRRILEDCRQQCQDGSLSSDDEERIGAGALGSAMGLFMSPYYILPGVFSGISGMLGGAMPYPSCHGFPFHPTATHRPPSPNVVTEEDIQKMIQVHRKRRLANEDHPELDTRFTSIQDIVTRTNPSKKPCKSSELSKKKDKKAKVKRKLKQKLQQKQDRQVQGKPGQGESARKEESAHASQNTPQISIPSNDVRCFFSLLREIFSGFSDSKANLQKIEDIVRKWQLSPSCTASTWSKQEPDWAKLVYSALIFLSGGSGESPPNFVPLVDFKERPQHWKWIGSQRDSDSQLEPLSEDWLRIKEELTSKKGLSAEGDSSSAPAARVKTDFVVRPSTEEERSAFRDQENERYANPHKAYTFRMHGFESVVGPVKGVFSKDTNLNKAREHSLLISMRPPYVTILTLVRDAASRLPNGEGTRAEVCELLKDSQFINPNSSDAQIHTVVSGALDRLHYERDPCVKYDSNRKVWIYLHRSRSEEEFEKIHQANAAAARAKKLQKPRVSRQPKNKDVPHTPLSLASPVQPKQDTSGQPVSVSSPLHADQLSVTQSTFTSSQEKEHAAQSPVTVPPKMQHTVESSLTGDSPGRKFTSALNTHTSVLNTADDSVSGSPLQLSGRAGVGEDSLGEVEKSRKESWSSDEDSSDGSSASDHESESGTAGSSSDGEREAKIHQGGGKTVPGEDQMFSVEEDQMDSQMMVHRAYGEDSRVLIQEAERKFSGETSSEQGSGSDSDFSTVD
ncbi:PREDICTED: nuclear factor related to kappa-B-binding protein-like isoform X3 [Acropora digitifera]|uniref:nuclear factor related to kappa-B-binding protein-like isoform X3 n=1 Tax=Acropora digitifera TaxID=70779 RepID=UPI00077A6100|nr:PREDICTED: nuclear factor related to kappa-B-binding protein-like isoform X3 [Acropora digitifera]